MIISFKHKGLKRLFYDDDHSGVDATYASKIQEILTFIDGVSSLQELTSLKYRIHLLTGNYAGYHSAVVSANYRIIFRFTNNGIESVDYVDYH